MTIYVLAPPAAAESTLNRLAGPDGSPTQAGPWRPRARLWYPERGAPAAPETDTLFVLDVADEADVLARGGRMSVLTATYFAAATDKASLLTGPYQRKGVAAKTAANGALLIPTVGLIRAEEFTVEMLVRSPGAAGSTITDEIIWIGTAGANDGLRIYKASGSTLGARFYVAGAAQAEAVITGIDSSDWPADVWKAVSVTWDGTTMTLRLGNNADNAPVTPTDLQSWAFEGGHIYFLSDSDGGGTSVLQVAELQILNTARIPGLSGASYPEAATITVDAATTDSSGLADVTKIAGVMGQYPYWRDTAVDGTGGSTSIRDQLFTALGESGCTLVRRDHIFDKEITLGGTAGAPTVTSWAAHDAVMDAIVAAIPGVSFHMTLGYTPALLGATPTTPPTNNTGFAALCSAAITHWKAKGYTLECVTLWNEPSLGSFWNGTSAQFGTMYAAVQAKLATDHPDVDFSHTDEHFTATEDTPTRQAIIDAPNGSMSFLGYHAYNVDDWDMRHLAATMRAYAITQGQDAALPIRCGEWAYDLDRISFYAGIGASTDVRSVKGHPTAGVDYAAACFRRMWNMVDAGFTSAIFTRMGILDTSFTGSEQMFGLFSHDDPPRPLPVYAAFQAMWKLTGTRKTATTNHPALRAFCASDAGVITVAYGAFRVWDPTELLHFNLELDGLPASFTWSMWRLDHRDDSVAASDGRLRLVAQGDETNLPMGTDLTAQGVGCLQITP